MTLSVPLLDRRLNLQHVQEPQQSQLSWFLHSSEEISKDPSLEIFTARIPKKWGRYCFHRYLSVHRGEGGYPISITEYFRPLVPCPFLGVPQYLVPYPFLGGYPLQSQWGRGVPIKSWWGGYPIQSQRGGGGITLAKLVWGTPYRTGWRYTPIETGWGTPCQDWMGYPPQQDRMGYSPPPPASGHAGGLSCCSLISFLHFQYFFCWNHFDEFFSQAYS